VTGSPLDLLPLPPVIHERMGHLLRELNLLRRLLRLSQAARDGRHGSHPNDRAADRREVAHG
jgi:hypothetical protein